MMLGEVLSSCSGWTLEASRLPFEKVRRLRRKSRHNFRQAACYEN
jgi:hypothetical protein